MKIKMKFYTMINEKGCVETCCYLDIGDGFEYFGTSKQNPLDKHNEHIGNRTALIELLTGESDSFTRKNRLEIWQHFHEHYKPESDRQKGFPTHFDGFPIDPPDREKGRYLKVKYEYVPVGDGEIKPDPIDRGYEADSMRLMVHDKHVGKDLDLRLRKIATHTTNITNAIKEIDRLMGGGDENYLRND